MTNYAFSIPIVKGKTDTWKKYVQEMLGNRRDDYNKSRQRIGLRLERVWLQKTPQGDIAVAYWETDNNPRTVFEHFMKSEDTFDKWFRDKILIECHGMKPNEIPPINDIILDQKIQAVGEKAYTETHKR